MPKHLGEFSVGPRVLLIVALAVLVGIVSALLAMMLQDQIGRASWRENVCQYVWIWGVAVGLQKKTEVETSDIDVWNKTRSRYKHSNRWRKLRIGNEDRG